MDLSFLDPWVQDIIADPISKQPTNYQTFPVVDDIRDARIFLRHTYGYNAWIEGQNQYEKQFVGRTLSVKDYLQEIENDRCIYDHFSLHGNILDCGGGAGTLRHFLPDDVNYISCDPWLSCFNSNSSARIEAYPCLSQKTNFIGAFAEFLPFRHSSFDFVHMRSMIDHVQVVDLALIEARRVLKPSGSLIIGLTVEGGKTGVNTFTDTLKDFAKGVFPYIGLNHLADHHIFHPTYDNLLKILDANSFICIDTFWQPCWNDRVCYVLASPS